MDSELRTAIRNVKSTEGPPMMTWRQFGEILQTATLINIRDELTLIIEQRLEADE